MNPCLLSNPADCDPHPQFEEIDWHLLKNNEPYPGGTPVRISLRCRDVRLWIGAGKLAMHAAGPQGVHVARMVILLLRAREEGAEGGGRGMKLCGAWWQVLLDIKWHLTARAQGGQCQRGNGGGARRADKGAAC